MRKKIKKLVSLLTACVALTALCACGEPAKEEITVTFMNGELDWCHWNGEDVIGQPKEFFCGRLVFSHASTSTCSLIQVMNLSFGTRMRVPIRMEGKPLERTSS